jgi:putative SOS response-associated peptidase YedK
VVWFATNDDRPLTAFAGIWTEFKGDRGTKSKPVPGPHLVYGFLTTAPNAVVGPIHPKAMPVILTTAALQLNLRACAGRDPENEHHSGNHTKKAKQREGMDLGRG